MKNLFKLLCALYLILSCVGCAALLPEASIFCPSTSSSSSYNSPDEESRKARNNSDSDFYLSYKVGVVANVPIDDKFSFEPGLHLAGKGNKTSTGSGSSKFENKLALTYIDIPLVTRYNLGDGGFSIYGGLQPSVLLKAKLKTDSGGNENTQDVKNQYKTFDFGATVGLGYRFDNGVRLNFGYDHGFANIASEDFGGFKTRNRGLKFGIGYELGKKNK